MIKRIKNNKGKIYIKNNLVYVRSRFTQEVKFFEK